MLSAGENSSEILLRHGPGLDCVCLNVLCPMLVAAGIGIMCLGGRGPVLSEEVDSILITRRGGAIRVTNLFKNDPAASLEPALFAGTEADQLSAAILDHVAVLLVRNVPGVGLELHNVIVNNLR